MLSLKKKGLVASVAALAMAVGGLGIGAGVANAADPADPALAQPSTDATSINYAGANKDYTYTVYELGKYLGSCPTDPTKDVSSVAVQSTGTPASTVVSDAASAAGVTLTGTDPVAAAAALNNGASYNAGIRKIMSHVTEASITAAGLTAATGATIDPTVASGTITVPEAGWYMVTAKGKDGKMGVASLAGTRCGTMAGAQGAVDLKNPDGNQPGDHTQQNPKKSMVGSVKEGGTVEFTLTATLPDYSKMTNIEYKLFDYPAVGLTPVTADAVVKVGNDTLKSPADYTISDGISAADKPMTVNGEDAGGKNFTVDLSKYVAANAASVQGKTLTVTYKATVDKVPTDLSKLNTFDVDNNGVRVPEGPDDPNGPHPGNDTPDPSKAKVQFTKVDENGKNLDGAEFTLTSDADPDIKTTATSTNGVVEFDNLGAGDYTISETGVTGAAADYMKSGSTIEVTVTVNKPADAKTPATETAKVSDNKADPADSSKTVDTDSTNVVTYKGAKVVSGVDTSADATLVKFENVKNLTQLPLTGAAGVVLFVVIAVLLAGGATVAVTVSKRNKKNALAL